MYNLIVQNQRSQVTESLSDAEMAALLASRYDDPAAHLPQLRDETTLLAFRSALMSSSEALKDKVVLVVGSGLGLIPMMCAQAGAHHVYGIEPSRAAETSRKVVEANQLQGRITIVHGDVHRAVLPVDKVDVLVMDFMDKFLMCGGGLGAFLTARQKWLAPGGTMYPDHATLYVMAVDDREHLAEEKQRWETCFGFNFLPALQEGLRYPRMDTPTRKSQLLSQPHALISLDLYTTSERDLAFKKPYSLTIERESRLSGLLTYHDVSFTCRSMQPNPITLSTHPLAPATRLEQTILTFPRAIRMSPGDMVTGVMTCVTDTSNAFALDVDVEVNIRGMFARSNYRVLPTL